MHSTHTKDDNYNIISGTQKLWYGIGLAMSLVNYQTRAIIYGLHNH